MCVDGLLFVPTSSVTGMEGAMVWALIFDGVAPLDGVLGGIVMANEGGKQSLLS